jgi:hypothetical protein
MGKFPIFFNQPVKNSTPDQTVGWKTHTLAAVGLQFKLPPFFNNLGEMKEEVKPATRGTSLCLAFTREESLLPKPTSGSSSCIINHFTIGTTSVDFNKEEKPEFIQLQGFKVEEEKYYAKFLDKEFAIPAFLVQKIVNPYQVEILVIRGTESEWYGSLSGVPRSKMVGALININNPTYPGLAVEMALSADLTEELFDQILATFRFPD